jgi:flagellar basal-body rod modification protein FlgD
MEVSATGSVGVSSSNKFAEMSSEEFINVLITELQNQDPLNPQDTNALLEQISSLRNIESQMSLSENLEALVTQNQVASAGNMIGKLVEGIDTLNANTVGLVTSVRVTSDGVFLELDNGRAMSMDQVTGISELPDAA